MNVNNGNFRVRFAGESSSYFTTTPGAELSYVLSNNVGSCENHERQE